MKPSSDRKLRVLVVDDSLFMRAAVAKLLTTDGRFEVVGQAKDGADAVDRVVELKPDVVTMDFNMPKMNGAEAVRAIMAKRPTPVIMFSAHTKQGARETFEALAAGAVDFVTKPGGEVSADLRGIADDLVGKLLAADRTARARHRSLHRRPGGAVARHPDPARHHPVRHRDRPAHAGQLHRHPGRAAERAVGGLGA